MLKIARKLALSATLSLGLSLGLLPPAVAGGLLNGEAILAEVNAGITNIGTSELQRRLAADPNLLLIDVRTPLEINLGGGAIDAPGNRTVIRGWLEFQVDRYAPDPDTPIVVYCGINQRSPLAARTLLDMGYTNVTNYADGFFAWKEAGLPVQQLDKARDSFLYSKPQQVAENIWSAIGATAPPTYDNSGHNNNLSFIITSDGVLVVNAGDNALLARALHDEIKARTDQPVRYVVLENGQGHAMLGTSYWQAHGAEVIAHEDAAHEIDEYGPEILERMQLRNGDKATGTVLSKPDRTFADKLVIDMGGERIELLNLGPAHSPGDIVVWLPGRKLVISGDMAFHERLLPVFEHTDTAGWIETWGRFEALGAEVVIPGHGGPTVMTEVRKYTRDYLVDVRAKIQQIIDDGGDLQAAYGVDQSAYRHLDTFDELARQNAGRIFRAMEFE